MHIRVANDSCFTFSTLQVSQAVTADYPDLELTTGLEVIAGLLYVPLSAGGRDFIAFLRKGQPRQVKWAGRPYKGEGGLRSVLEPRASFKTWAETVAGRCRVWSDEHLETAGVLALVYGKFIEVWRQKESALQTTKLTNLLLSNASHEGASCPATWNVSHMLIVPCSPHSFEPHYQVGTSTIYVGHFLMCKQLPRVGVEWVPGQRDQGKS